MGKTRLFVCLVHTPARPLVRACGIYLWRVFTSSSAIYKCVMTFIFVSLFSFRCLCFFIAVCVYDFFRFEFSIVFRRCWNDRNDFRCFFRHVINCFLCCFFVSLFRKFQCSISLKLFIVSIIFQLCFFSLLNWSKYHFLLFRARDWLFFFEFLFRVNFYENNHVLFCLCFFISNVIVFDVFVLFSNKFTSFMFFVQFFRCHDTVCVQRKLIWCLWVYAFVNNKNLNVFAINEKFFKNLIKFLSRLFAFVHIFFFNFANFEHFNNVYMIVCFLYSHEQIDNDVALILNK